MLLFWKIRYLDRSDRQFKDRCLYLLTKTLDPITRAAVEFIAENRSPKTERDILKYRHLFTEDDPGEPAAFPGDPNGWDKGLTVGPFEYCEDENCKEITPQEMGPILTGSPTARLIPSGARQHDIDFMFAEPKPMPYAEVSLTSEEIRILGYFARDLQEMLGSAFRKDGPGRLKMSGSMVLSPACNPTLETAATDDEIRSFITIFRRLYMAKEPANFLKAVAVFCKALGNHRHSKWVAGVATEYRNHLAAVMESRPFLPPGACTFTTKKLIEVFLYTQYAHQPDHQKEREFAEYLNEVHGKPAVLTWLFLSELSKCSMEMGNAGKVIAGWFANYCDHHGIVPDVLKSLLDDHSGLGAAEKEDARRDRLFGEQAEKLAKDLWAEAGRPQGGYTQFLALARERLAHVLQG